MIYFNLKEMMKEYDIGHRELSRKTGIRQGTIGDYVNNTFKMINRNHLDILCNFFNCDISDLIIKKIREIDKYGKEIYK